MRNALPLVLASLLSVACSSSSEPATTTDAGNAGDTSASSSDTGGGTTDTGGTTAETGGGSCGGTVASDPCFKQFRDAFASTASCFNHPDTCKASGDTDPSGCGTSTDMGLTCKWPDGSQQATKFDAATGKVDITVTGAGGTVCYSLHLMGTGSSGSGTYEVGGKTFPFTSTKSGSSTTTTLSCPDGSKVTFTDADVKDCPNGGGTCCSSSTPAKC